MAIKIHPISVQKQFCERCNIRHPVVFDVGARGGSPLREYIQAFKGSVIHAFEPEPGAYRELVRQYGKDPRVVLSKVALANSTGVTDLYLHGGGTDSLLKRAPGPVYYPPMRNSSETVRIPVTTLDAYCGEHGVKPDILKMDIQGSELAALKGGTETLPTVTSVYCEVSFTPIYEYGPMYHHIAMFMEHMGFRLFRIYFLTHAKDGQARQGDALFVNTRYERRGDGLGK